MYRYYVSKDIKPALQNVLVRGFHDYVFQREKNGEWTCLSPLSEKKFEGLVNRAVCEKKSKEDGVFYITSEESENMIYKTLLLESAGQKSCVVLDDKHLMHGLLRQSDKKNEMYERLKDFIPELFRSEEMGRYLYENAEKLHKWRIIDMIGQAPISLFRKKKMLESLVQFEDLEAEMEENGYGWEQTYEFSLQHALECLSVVLDDGLQAKENEFFILYERFGGRAEGQMGDVLPYASYKMAYDAMHGEHVDYEDEMLWHTMEKWVRKPDGTMEELYEFTFFKGEPVAYRKKKDGTYADSKFELQCDLNLPVPFQPGDILEIDSTPTCEKKRVLVWDIGDNEDCCSVQVIYLDEDGLLSSGALKHDSIFRPEYDALPTLYSARRYTGELEGREKCYLEIQKFILDNWELWQKNGRRVWFHLDGKAELPENFFKELMRQLKEQTKMKAKSEVREEKLE